MAACLGSAGFALCPGHLQGIWDGAALYLGGKKGGNVVKCRKEAGKCVICCCIMTDCLRLPVFPPESGSVVAFLAVISVIFCSLLTEKYDIFSPAAPAIKHFD